jgi:hypothetical protein
MPQGDGDREAVDRFIMEEIDTIPHLEALLLLWRNQKPWSPAEMGKALYVSDEAVEKVLQDLVRRSLATLTPGDVDLYSYDSGAQQKNHLLRLLDEAYRRDLIRITRMIHGKASPAVREFARAFRFKKD